MTFVVYQYAYSSAADTIIGSQISVSPTAISGAAVGTAISGTTRCSGTSCSLKSSKFSAQVPKVNGSARGESYYTWSSTTGATVTALPG